jgi:hypothetical protein
MISTLKTTMKIKTLLVSCITISLAIPLLAGNFFSVGGASISNATHNAAYAIVPASGGNNGEGTPRIQFVSWTTDVNNATQSIYRVHSTHRVTAASGGATNKIYASATLAAPTNSIYVLRHANSEIYERLVNTTNHATTILGVTPSTGFAVAVGDTLYLMTNAASLPSGYIPAIAANGSGTNSILKETMSASGIYNGADGEPILVQVQRATNGVLHVVSGAFVK